MAGAEPSSAPGAAWRDRRHRKTSSSYCSTCSSRSSSASVSPFRLPSKRPRRCTSRSSSDESLSRIATSSKFKKTRQTVSTTLEEAGSVHRQSRRRKRSTVSWHGSDSSNSETVLRKGPPCRTRKGRKGRFGSWSPVLSSSTESVPAGRRINCGRCPMASSEVNLSALGAKRSAATHRLVAAAVSPGCNEGNTRFGGVKRGGLSFAGTSVSARKQLGAEAGLVFRGTRSAENLAGAASRERARSACMEAGDFRNAACRRPNCHSSLGSRNEEHVASTSPQPVMPLREQQSLPEHIGRAAFCSCQEDCACELVSLVMKRCKLTASTAAATSSAGSAGASDRSKFIF